MGQKQKNEKSAICHQPLQDKANDRSFPVCHDHAAHCDASQRISNSSNILYLNKILTVKGFKRNIITRKAHKLWD